MSDTDRLEHRTTDPLISIYSNAMSVGASFFDFQIIVGQMLPSGAGLAPMTTHVENKAVITMSWEHAKALAQAMTKTIADYETKYGAIREKHED